MSAFPGLGCLVFAGYERDTALQAMNAMQERRQDQKTMLSMTSFKQQNASHVNFLTFTQLNQLR